MEYPNPIEPATLQNKVKQGVTDHPVKVTPPPLCIYIPPFSSLPQRGLNNHGRKVRNATQCKVNSA